MDLNLFHAGYRARGHKKIFMLNSTEHEISLLMCIKTKMLENKDFSCFQTLMLINVYHANKC